MKKTIFAFGMMLAATLSLTNCSKEMDAPQEVSKDGVPFELFADVAQTKTAITGWATRWVNDDKVNVFHAVAGSTTYYDDGQFSVDATDLTVGRFTGTIAPENLPVSGKYDWYAIYPYSNYIKSPANTGSNPGRTTIGKASNQSQVQNGNNATNHLSGSAFPLYGVATDVDFDASPSITLNNIVSVVEVKVTNKNDAPLVVSSVSFTAPEGTTIVGQYEINYAANPMTFTDYSTYTSSVANLTVNNGAAIAKDAYASFYIGIKPFTATTGQVLKLSVNGYEKSVTLTKDFTFASGKIKTINFYYDSLVDIFTWDLTTNSYSAASDNQVTWSEDNVATMVADKYNATTNTNNYLPTDKTSTRFYANSKLTFTPASGMEITKIQAEATSEGYANALRNSTWTNATASVDDKIVTIIPQDGSIAFNGVMYATTGLNWVKVYYRVYVPRTLTGIVVTTAPSKTDYFVGETLNMAGAVITANYDNSTSENVTASVTTDGAEVLAHAGNAKPVTVSYLGKTATFNVNVAKAEAGLSFDTSSYTVAPNANFSTPSLSNPHGLTVTYSSSDDTLVLVDENSGAVVIGSQVGGPVTITASTAGNDDYKAGSATYTITISNQENYSTKNTSNVNLSTTGGTNASAAKVRFSATGTQYDAIKCGTSSKAGAMKLTVPSGTTKLHVHIAAWNGESVTITVTPKDNVSGTNSFSVVANSGVSSNSPFTISADTDTFYKCVNLTGIEADTEFTIAATSGKRFVIWGVNAE